MPQADLSGLPVLTVLPPWGSAIARWGKPWENRPMPPPRTIRGKRLVIHQGVLPLTARGKVCASPAGQRFAAALARVAALSGQAEAALLDQLRADEGRVLCTVIVQAWAGIEPGGTTAIIAEPPFWRVADPVPLDPWMIPDPERRVYAWRLDEMSVVDGGPRLRGQQGIWRMP